MVAKIGAFALNSSSVESLRCKKIVGDIKKMSLFLRCRLFLFGNCVADEDYNWRYVERVVRSVKGKTVLLSGFFRGHTRDTTYS